MQKRFTIEVKYSVTDEDKVTYDFGVRGIKTDNSTTLLSIIDDQLASAKKEDREYNGFEIEVEDFVSGARLIASSFCIGTEGGSRVYEATVTSKINGKEYMHGTPEADRDAMNSIELLLKKFKHVLENKFSSFESGIQLRRYLERANNFGGSQFALIEVNFNDCRGNRQVLFEYFKSFNSKEPMTFREAIPGCCNVINLGRGIKSNRYFKNEILISDDADLKGKLQIVTLKVANEWMEKEREFQQKNK